MTSAIGLDASFFIGIALTPVEGEASEADPESEPEELLGLAFRLRWFTRPFTVGLWEASDLGSCARAPSFSSSASLSELELDKDLDDKLFFNGLLDFLLGFCAGVPSLISTSESIFSSLLSLPLLLVMSFPMTSAAAASLALASAFIFTFVAFLDFLTAFVSSLSSLSLLLVSSTSHFS